MKAKRKEIIEMMGRQWVEDEDLGWKGRNVPLKF